MPAVVNKRVGSPCGTKEAVGIRRCPCFSKKLTNDSRNSLTVRGFTVLSSGTPAVRKAGDSLDEEIGSGDRAFAECRMMTIRRSIGPLMIWWLSIMEQLR